MKKDKEYLQSVIQRRIDNLPSTCEGLYIEGSRDAYDLVLQDIDQLDEPEVLSSEWVDENKFEVNGWNEAVHVEDLQNLLVPKQEITFDQVHDKLREESILSEKSFDYYWNCINDNVEIDEPGNLIVPKQELPAIPKFVADWVLRYRDKYDLYPALRILENNTFVWGPIYEWYRMNTHEFVNAYLTGEYEVEEEQRYYILDSYDIPLLERVGNQIQKTTTELSIHEKARDTPRFELTEQEIKNYDERFWPFAEPVEELEE